MLYSLISKTLVAFAMLTASSALFADEIILDESQDPVVALGDFNCTTCRANDSNTFAILPGAKSVTAGQLWTYFNDRGIESIDRLTICMDVDPEAQTADTGVDCVELSITDPFNEATLTTFSMDRGGDNSLIVPSYEASAFRAEAQMEIMLPFDFMKEFSKDSSEKIVLNVKMADQASAQPTFFITPRNSYFALPDLFTLSVFTAFWVFVFLILYRYTNPEAMQARSKRQAISV